MVDKADRSAKQIRIIKNVENRVVVLTYAARINIACLKGVTMMTNQHVHYLLAILLIFFVKIRISVNAGLLMQLRYKSFIYL